MPAPVINSANSATGNVGSPFSYQITATNTPTSFAAAPLPTGLSVNTATGLISGTPALAAASSISLTAANASGTSPVVTLTLTVGASTSDSLNKIGFITDRFGQYLTLFPNRAKFEIAALHRRMLEVTPTFDPTPSSPPANSSALLTEALTLLNAWHTASPNLAKHDIYRFNERAKAISVEMNLAAS